MLAVSAIFAAIFAALSALLAVFASVHAEQARDAARKAVAALETRDAERARATRKADAALDPYNPVE